MQNQVDTLCEVEVKALAVLNHCLEKMANALQKNFDPDNPKSIRLLQQFRSTLNERRRILTSIEKARSTSKKPQPASVKHKKPDNFKSMHTPAPHSVAASGLLYNPAKVAV